MDYYQDMTLLPDAEANLGFLWQKVYQQIHLALVENKVAEQSSKIGLSIPEYSNKAFPLGSKIRLIAKDEGELEEMNIAHWLRRFQDYVHIKSIQPVPKNVTQYALFTRKHIKGEARIAKDIDKKAQHQSAKFNVPYDECVKKLTETAPYGLSKLPFIHIQSLSTAEQQDGRLFPLFIDLKLVDQAKENTFSCYGLSSKQEGQISTVPWF